MAHRPRASVSWTAGASAARPRFRTHGNLSHHECFSSARKRRRRSRSAGALHRPPQTAIGRVFADGHHGARPPIGALLGSAPVPVAVFGVAPKTVSQTEWFHPWFGRDARTRTRDGRAPLVRPTQTAFGTVSLCRRPPRGRRLAKRLSGESCHSILIPVCGALPRRRYVGCRFQLAPHVVSHVTQKAHRPPSLEPSCAGVWRALPPSFWPVSFSRPWPFPTPTS